MNKSRRSFLRAGGMMGLTTVLTARLGTLAFGQQAGALGTGGFPVPRTTLKDPLYLITRDVFIDHLNTKFSFSTGGVYLADLVLADIKDMNQPSIVKNDGTGVRDCFALIFRGPARLPLAQRTYSVVHKTLGRFDLFIVPGDRTAPTGPNYVATINRTNA